MYLSALLTFPLMAIAQGSNRLSGPGFRAAYFAKAIKDRKLKASFLRELEVASEISCLFECTFEDRCLSYNFLPVHGKVTNRCQLSSSDRFINGVNFTKEDGAIYRGIQVTIALFWWNMSLGREFVENVCFDKLWCHPVRFKCFYFSLNLLLTVWECTTYTVSMYLNELLVDNEIIVSPHSRCITALSVKTNTELWRVIGALKHLLRRQGFSLEHKHYTLVSWVA